MPKMERSTQAHAVAASIEAMLTFAEEQKDYLLAAKLEDVRHTFAERYMPAK